MSYLIDGEKCPSRSEELRKGWGLSCANNCEDKKLEEEHRRATPLMVNHLLPNWGVKVDCPKEWEAPKKGEKIIWSKAHPIPKKIIIPWYTLRNKKKFFHDVPHEVAHISAYEKKFDIQTKKILQGLENLTEKWKTTLPNSPERKAIENGTIFYANKHKKIFINFWKEMKLSKKGHWKNPWYSDYVEFHKKLFNSTFAKYAYGNTIPLPYEKSFQEEE